LRTSALLPEMMLLHERAVLKIGDDIPLDARRCSDARTAASARR